MIKILRSIFYFLPVQLVLLHLRKYRLLMVFWLILYFTITGVLASHFGAYSLFLGPEYLGYINFTSMFLLGGSLCVFMMTWHITTFVVHSNRIPYMGATRQAFIVYCINNSVIPVLFLVFYTTILVRYLRHDEGDNVSHILLLLLGFYLGMAFVTFLSFAYFFSVSRNLFKAVISRITNPMRIKEIIPYDSLDYEIDIIPAQSYISNNLRIEKSTDLEPYHPRVMATVLRRHHRNVIFGTFMCFVALIILGTFKEQPLLRAPAGCGFLLLFSIIMGFVAAVKYFLKSWEAIGWVVIILLTSVSVSYKVFDVRSIAYGINYNSGTKNEPEYNYGALRRIFNWGRYQADRKAEEDRLNKWKAGTASDSDRPVAVIITASGGGSRSAYWTFRVLQFIDSASQGRLFRNAIVITGASGGMIGATYWRNLHDVYMHGCMKEPYLRQYQDNIGKDLLNAIIFALASVDVLSPFSKVKLGPYTYQRSRGYAMEQEMVANTDRLLNGTLGYWGIDEQKGLIPQIIFTGTIVNDGRRLLMCNQPVGYLTQPEYSLNDPFPVIDCIDFCTMFSKQDSKNLLVASALRMNATFPLVLPVVKLPSNPRMNIMDAGLRDNFGSEIASRYVFAMRGWLKNNTSRIIQLDIRDTRENFVGTPTEQKSLIGMMTDPLFSIQNRWEAFQSFNHTYIEDLSPACMDDQMQFVTLRYRPAEANKNAELNFHLTQREKADIYRAIYYPENLAAVNRIMKLLADSSNISE